MGVEFNVKCKKCSYGLSINLGIGKFYDPDSIFYGLCNSGRMLTSLVKNKPIRMTTFQLLSEGAVPLIFVPFLSGLFSVIFGRASIGTGYPLPLEHFKTPVVTCRYIWTNRTLNGIIIKT